MPGKRSDLVSYYEREASEGNRIAELVGFACYNFVKIKMCEVIHYFIGRYLFCK